MKEGWELKEFNEVYIVKDGTHDSPKYVNEGFPLITSKNLKNGQLDFSNIKYISELDYSSINKRSKVNQGDLLFAMIGTIGNPVVICDEPNFAIKNIALFKPQNDSIFYLKYYLESKNVVDKMNSESKGTTQKFVSLGYLRAFPIPIPPLAEQEAIVAKLDEAFAQIEKAKANLLRNIDNAKALFQSKLNQIFSQKGDDWEEKKLGEVCEVIAGQSPEGKFYNNDKLGEPFYQGKKEFGDKFINEPNVWTKSVTKIAEKNDILMSVRAPVGPINISIQRCCIGRGLAAIRPNSNLNRDYLFYFLKFNEDRITGNQGAVFNSINKKQIENITMPYIDIKIQEAIVQQLDQLSAYTQTLERNYQQQLEALEELRKSILEKAFKGELV